MSTGQEERAASRTPSQQSEENTSVASPSQSLDRKQANKSDDSRSASLSSGERQQFTGNVTSLFGNMKFSTMDDDDDEADGETSPEISGTSALVSRMLTSSSHEDGFSPSSRGATSPQSAASSSTSPRRTSKEAMLATASAGIRKERALPDMYDADLAALLKITEQQSHWQKGNVKDIALQQKDILCVHPG